ncbi:paraquat-inducible protein A [Pseudoruegeria sp. SK021]|uniref:paraquat-inducible protein A n=1 Tax=Pseudoruegeria sp. SK021 TaxID=1933035 RepID=UPI001F0A4D7F|nr:paraquat-inducible protein A [Pseudoruegeria sp. SK021]
MWAADQARCTRCGGTLSSRAPHSLQRVLAWWLAGFLAYIPANLYPMLITDTVKSKSASTIVGGVIELVHYHAYFVAGVVFLASVIIPISKFIAIAYVVLSIRFPRKANSHTLLKIHELVEFIGRWSMVDVFVVAILSALVHLGSVADIFPGVAAICFASSVICTMMAAISLDPRLIWDATEDLNQ